MKQLLLFIHKMLRRNPKSPPGLAKLGPLPAPPPKLAHDPVEDTEAYKAIAQELEQKLTDLFAQLPADDNCTIWAAQQRILREDYGIEWKAPYELEENREIIFFYLPGSHHT